LAKPNFEFQKRQKELEKKRKKEEKKQRKLDRAAAPPAEGSESADSTTTPVEPGL
jgi:Skp family chaperone for outer membrane proteins